jgi:Tfp pilus assembly protein PilX
MYSTNVPRRFLLLLLTFAAISLTQLAQAQTDQARIAGLVTDANGAIVPGASILVKNERTGEERTATASESGSYIVSALRPSLYTVTASAQNLHARVAGVQLFVGQETTLNLTLQAIGVEEKVDR